LLDEENFQEDIEDVEEEPLVRQRSRRVLSRNAETAEAVQRPDSPPLSPQPHQHNGGFAEVIPLSLLVLLEASISVQYSFSTTQSFFHLKWGGISSEEHDEAVMLEAAMFGGIPEHTAYPFPRPSHGISAGYPRVAHPPSPTLTAQRLIREQQVWNIISLLEIDYRDYCAEHLMFFHRRMMSILQPSKLIEKKS
jgi:hypothetical protein